jgi:hypothetical protein
MVIRHSLLVTGKGQRTDDQGHFHLEFIVTKLIFEGVLINLSLIGIQGIELYHNLKFISQNRQKWEARSHHRNAYR